MTKAENTRFNILQKAFGLIYRQGYQATSVDEILVDTLVTKGAFFYHFKTKEEMAIAMIKELIYPGMYKAIITPLEQTTDPISTIRASINGLLMDTILFDARYGCPAVNLIEEMAPLNPAFHQILGRLVNEWQQAIATSLDQGKTNGIIRADVDTKRVACFIVAGYSGIRNLGKLIGKACYKTHLAELENYLNTLY